MVKQFLSTGEKPYLELLCGRDSRGITDNNTAQGKGRSVKGNAVKYHHCHHP